MRLLLVLALTAASLPAAAQLTPYRCDDLARPAARQGRQVDIIFGAVASDDGPNAIIEGATNLPGGTRLGMSVGGNGRIFERETIVKPDGAFRFPPIPAPVGSTYGASVAMLTASMQPANVRCVVGQNGEFMRGPSVTVIPAGAAMVGYSFRFTR